MKALLRGRVAAIALIVASAGSLALDASFAASGAPPSVWLRLGATAAWIPAIEAIEHFLKRKSEIGSLVLSGLGTIGVLGGLIAIAMSVGSVDLDSGRSLRAAAEWTSRLLPLALGTMGLALLRFAAAPPRVCVALLIGGIGLAASECVGGHALSLPSNSAIAIACGWIAVRVLREPDSWRSAAL
jgi:hypothetical protein